MCRDADFLKTLHQQIAHSVVYNTLADDRSFLEPVERCGIILVGNDKELRVIGCKYLFCLSFVELFFLGHIYVPPDFSNDFENKKGQ